MKVNILIERKISSYLKDFFNKYPVLTITGPRQSGKTTLARKTFPDLKYCNLEDLEERAFAREDPRGFLKSCRAGAIIDEIQNVPELTSYIQVICDEENRAGMFVLTGSQQFEIMQTISQSLAGRTALFKLLPFALHEITNYFPGLSNNQLIYKGFYPRIYDKELEPAQALADYYTTYIERDLRNISQVHNLHLFQKFVRLCAGRTGSILSLSALANDTGITHTTARAWISILEASYIVFLLPPYFSNLNKRLIKSPKLYFYDVGLAAHLLGIENAQHVDTHPLKGALFENLAIMEILKFRFNNVKSNNLYFFRDSKGNELDLFYSIAHQIIPIEIKAGETINSDFFKGFKYFDKNLELESPLKILIYGGELVQERSGVSITTVKNICTLLDKY